MLKDKQINVPYDNNDEIQHVPSVSDIRVLMHHQAVRYDLQEGFDRENDKEGIFNCFLWETKEGERNELIR